MKKVRVSFKDSRVIINNKDCGTVHIKNNYLGLRVVLGNEHYLVGSELRDSKSIQSCKNRLKTIITERQSAREFFGMDN